MSSTGQISILYWTKKSGVAAVFFPAFTFAAGINAKKMIWRTPADQTGEKRNNPD
jgi:hypothetical protein